MSNFILITDKDNKDFIVKKSAIRRVYSNFPKEETIISFTERHTPPITVNGTVKEFFTKLNSK